jgi:putative aldouronate transport system permease protein
MAGTVIAFKDFRFDLGIWGSKWIGFKNFEFFFKSTEAVRITANTLGYNIAFIVLGTIINVFLALLLNEVRNKSAIKLYQTVIFIPHFMSWVVVAFIVYAFVSPAYGIIGRITESLGGESVNLFTKPEAWRGILVFTGLWKYIGFGLLINYATLLGVDHSYYEAAQIDGASKLRIIWNISIPFLVPVILIQFILSVGRIFYADFGLFYQVPQNAPMLYKTTDVIDTYVFRALMEYGDMGISAAVGLFQSFVGMMLVLIANKIVKSIREENALF